MMYGWKSEVFGEEGVLGRSDSCLRPFVRSAP